MINSVIFDHLLEPFFRMNGKCVANELCYEQECPEHSHFEDCRPETQSGCCGSSPDICYARMHGKDGKKSQERIVDIASGDAKKDDGDNYAKTQNKNAAWYTTVPPHWDQCNTGCFCDDGYVQKELWNGNFECVPEETCTDTGAFCEAQGENMEWVENDCLDSFYCCDDPGTDGVCQSRRWYKNANVNGGGGGGSGGGTGDGSISPAGPTFGETSPPGALAANLPDDQIFKVDEDIINTWTDCLSVTPGITDGFIALFDSAFVAALNDFGSVLPYDGIGGILEQKITDYIWSDPSGDFMTIWDQYRDPGNPNCFGCWDAQVIRAELQLRALNQWGEDTSVAGFETIEDFCAFDFTTIVTCADDGNTLTPGEISTRINGLGLPQGIYDALHESPKVSYPTTAPYVTTPYATTAAPVPWPSDPVPATPYPATPSWPAPATTASPLTCHDRHRRCVCPPTHAWDKGSPAHYPSNVGCVPKDKCRATFQQCGENQRWVNEGTV